MSLSVEQQYAMSLIKSDECSLLKVNAVAGSGKTHLLRAIAKELNPINGIYIAYNKSVADEANEKFGEVITCSSIHSKAYKQTVRQLGLQVGGNFSAHSIRERYIGDHIYLEPERKDLMASFIEKFLVSKYIKFDDFIQAESKNIFRPEEIDLCKSYLNKMKTGQIKCSHNFYLKIYHMMLESGTIIEDEADLLMLDEAGDTNAVTLKIFLLLPAKKKVMVGDNQQNIYTFNHTINGFEALKHVGHYTSLTRTFRVDAKISEAIESFSQKFLDPTMRFVGMDYPEGINVNSHAYISRNNSALVETMIELDERKVKYNLTRTPEQIFEVHMILLNLKPDMEIRNPDFAHLKRQVEYYYNNKQQFIDDGLRTAYAYIIRENADNQAIMLAHQSIAKYSAKTILDCYYNAKRHKKDTKKHFNTLTTVFSSKGLEWDSITILDDLNDSVSEAIHKANERADENNIPLSEAFTDDDRTTFRLYYVACSRCKYEIHNAMHLDLEQDYN
jgi:hypothetical protein